MGGSQSTSRGEKSNMSAVVDKMLTDPQVPTTELIKLRDAVFTQKSMINKSQEQALRVVLESIDKTREANDSYQKLNRAIRSRTNSARARVSNSPK